MYILKNHICKIQINILFKLLGFIGLIVLLSNCEKKNNPPIFENTEFHYYITVDHHNIERRAIANFQNIVADPDGDEIFFEVQGNRFNIGRESGILEVLNLQVGETISTILTVSDGELSASTSIDVTGR